MMQETPYGLLAELLLRGARHRSQQEIADWCGVSQPAVSSWFSGRKRPQQIHLANLAYLLDVDPKELAIAAGVSPEKITFLYESLVSKGFFSSLQFATEMLALIKQARIISPQLALEQCKTIGSYLRNVLAHLSDVSHREPFLRLLSQVLAEQGRIYSETSLVDIAVNGMLQIANELDTISLELKDNQVLGLKYTTLGALNYRLKRHGKSLEYHSQAVGLIELKDWVIDVVRAMAVGAGQTQNKKRFSTVEGRIKAMLEQDQHLTLSNTSYLLEGLARGQAYLGQDESWTTLQEVKNMYHQTHNFDVEIPLRRLQLIRSQIAVVIQLNPNDTQLIIELATEGKKLGQLYGYQRYVSDIDQLLLQTKERVI
jgi:transcriptional regulator with XRE-family HTH domain